MYAKLELISYYFTVLLMGLSAHSHEWILFCLFSRGFYADGICRGFYDAKGILCCQ